MCINELTAWSGCGCMILGSNCSGLANRTQILADAKRADGSDLIRENPRLSASRFMLAEQLPWALYNT